MTTQPLRFFITAACCVGSLSAHAQSAWLPPAQGLNVTPGFSFSTFDEFWMGDERTSNPPNGKSLDQYTGYVFLEYGILKNLAADATVGYSATDTDAFGGDASDDGLMDTSLGLRYRILDERNAPCRWAPTVAVRTGVVIPGTYDENQPFSVGDGAFGFEASLLLAKAFGNTGFGMYGDIGYRVRENPVPDDAFGSVGLYKQLGRVTLAFGYRHVQGLSGLDIGGPGFDPDRGVAHGFPAVREINQIVEGSVSYTDKGGRNYQVTVASSVDGRNTGDKFLVGFNVTIPFGGH